MSYSTYLIMKVCFLFILSMFISLIFSSNVLKAQGGLQQKPPLDLIFKTLDLKFQTEDLKGVTQEMEGTVQGLEMKETETEIKVELSGDVLFDFDKWDIRPAAEPVLQQVADIIKQYPDSNVLIQGYTDSKGSDSYNLRLSEKRAQSVKRWLVTKGGAGENKITTKGLGEANPVAPNENPDGSDNPEGRQKNRRVEITVKK